MLALFTKPIELLTAEDVTAIVGWPESLTVEFKKTLSAREGRTDAWLTGGNVEQHARDRLFKEVVAFANTSGGHLVLGVKETEDAPPAAAVLVPVPRCVELAERLGRAAQIIDPPIPLLLVRGIPVQGDAGVVVFRVPASRAAPHRGPDKECYVRRGTESVPMSMREIQDMTLAAGRREEFIDARFALAKRTFTEWFATPLEGQALATGFRIILPGEAQAAGFHITAVPVGVGFDLGRLYGRDDLTRLRERYPLTVDSRRVEANAPRLPNRARPIIRGVRQTYGEGGEPIYLDLYSNGVVDLGFRMGPRDSKLLIMLSWLVAYAINVLRTADALRTAAGAPDWEYGIEVELHSDPVGHPVNLIGWGDQFSFDHQIGRGLQRLPLLLPRLSFGKMADLDQIVSLLTNDLCDGAGASHLQPLSLSIDPLHL